jgi:hypothetical protein
MRLTVEVHCDGVRGVVQWHPNRPTVVVAGRDEQGDQGGTYGE